jgi:hypothetical protein
LDDKEVRVVDAETDGVCFLADVFVPQGLEAGEEEGAGCGEVGDCEGDVGEGHCGSLLERAVESDVVMRLTKSKPKSKPKA